MEALGSIRFVHQVTNRAHKPSAVVFFSSHLCSSAPLSRRVIMDTHSIRSMLPFYSPSSIYSATLQSLHCFSSTFIKTTLLVSIILIRVLILPKLDDRLEELSLYFSSTSHNSPTEMRNIFQHQEILQAKDFGHLGSSDNPYYPTELRFIS